MTSNLDKKMNAIVFESFGNSSVLKLAKVPVPSLQDGEVLIRVSHTSVNPVDWKIREGYLQSMMPHRFPIIPGWDASGIVAQVAEGVHQFKVGDRVYAYSRLPEVHSGTYAEYIALPQSYLAKLPESIDSAKAASVPLVALTAYQALHEQVKIKAGDKVLVTGGAGGVGSFAIQFAKLVGAEVTTTASEPNHGYVKSLGADHVINYRNDNVTIVAKQIAPQGFDVVFDAVGGPALAQAISLLRDKGRVVSIVETPASDLLSTKSATGTFHFVYPDGNTLTKITTLIQEGKIQLPHLEVRNIALAAAAQDENQKRHVRGKVVLEVAFQ